MTEERAKSVGQFIYVGDTSIHFRRLLFIPMMVVGSMMNMFLKMFLV